MDVIPGPFNYDEVVIVRNPVKLACCGVVMPQELRRRIIANPKIVNFLILPPPTWHGVA
jgi:hypothetical protein